ncbi:hypothetical protein [uncultured Methylobacterium sp.]|uniref:hypothetical protein n=1 Tax=uncultured Methylobacterium sp. TaxID=157278 RepID=UPI0035CB12CF
MRTSAAKDHGGSGGEYSRYDPADDDDFYEHRHPTSGDRPQRPPGLFWRMVRLVRLLVFILPLSLMLIGSFVVDCRNRSGNGFLPDIVRASACAREDLTGHLSGMSETMRTISRAIR